MSTGQLGSLVVSIEANVARFQSDMGKVAAVAQQNAAQVQKAFDVVGTSLKALGAGFVIGLTIDKVKGQIESAIQSAAGLQQLAERTGATVEGLSGLASAAKLSGTDADALAGGLQKLSKSMVDAQNGGKATTAALNAIGLSARDLTDKSPDQAFLKIAQRLAEYGDGAGKTAVAQALLGKSGANLLPVMKDLAEIGELQVKTTARQAQMADDYEKTLTRLSAAQNGIYKRIAFETLPVMAAFAETMLESAKQGNGLAKSVNGLASDGSLRSWAETGAIAIGTVVEAITAVLKALDAMQSSVQVVLADLKVFGTFNKNGGLPGLVFEGNRDELRTVLDERNKTLETANKKWSELWSYNGTAFTDSLRKRFAEQRQAEAAATAGGVASAPGKPQVRLGTSDEEAAKEAAKAAESFILQLQRAVQQQEKGRFEMLRLEAAQKGVSAAAEPFIQKLEAAERVQKDLLALSERAAVLAEQQARSGEYQSGGVAMARSLKEQTELLGLNEKQQRRVTALRKLDALALTAYANASVETIDQVVKQFENLRAGLVQALDGIEAREQSLTDSFSYGAGKAFDEYLQSARDASKNAESLVTGGLQRMEDALINFAKTGKLNFSDLFGFMAEEYLRQQIRMSVADFSKGGAGANGTSILANLASMFIGFGGTSHANGLSYVPYDNYPALLHEGEKVVTKAEVQAGGWSGGASVSVGAGQVINIGQGVSRAEVYAAVSQANAKSRADLMRTLRERQVTA